MNKGEEMENKFLENAVQAMILYAEGFKTNCKLATLQDDNTTSKQEAKLLKKINSATDDFINSLKKLK